MRLRPYIKAREREREMYTYSVFSYGRPVGSQHAVHANTSALIWSASGHLGVSRGNQHCIHRTRFQQRFEVTYDCAK